MARRKEGCKTWKYSMEFKARAVEMSLQEGIQVQQVAEGLGIHPFMLSRWRKEYREGRIVRDRHRRMDVMGFLYLRWVESAYGMAYYANRKRQRRSKNRAVFSNGGRIFYGSNPALYGRQDSDLSVSRDEQRKIEVVRWVEPPYYRQNPEANYAIELVEPPKAKELTRPLHKPIGIELHV